VGVDFASLVNKTEGKDGSDRNDSIKVKENSPSPAPDAVTSYVPVAREAARTPVESPAQETRIPDQIAASIIARSELVVREGHTEFHLHLEPPELGSVRVHLTATDRGISARLFVHEPSARQLIQSQLESLRQRLKEAGIAVGRFDVAGNDAGSQKQRGHDQSEERSEDLGEVDRPGRIPQARKAGAFSSRVVDVVA
jgi:flagellar hook-length control protein FliK